MKRPLRNSVQLLGLMMALIPLLGCNDYEDLQTIYGRRSGLYVEESVNGTGVLGGMFEAAGHSVRSRRYLSPKLAETDVIVWFPDSFEPPTEEVSNWLDDWLEEGGHTLIYVGRDYDSEQYYWEEVYPKMPANLQADVKQYEQNAESRFKAYRHLIPEEADGDWFSIDGTAKPKDVKTLKGPWADGIDVSQAKIKLNSRLIPADWAETLLETEDGEMLVSREWTEDSYSNTESKLIIVANGSFLLNYPLINHEHRKLAGKLISEVPEDASVVFLEGANPPISDHEPEEKIPTGLEMFSVWPINWVLVHLGVIGVFFLLARWPIFGLAREIKEGSDTDFGRHVGAMADLLARTKDRGFALARLNQYRQLTGKESASEARTATPSRSATEPVKTETVKPGPAKTEPAKTEPSAAQTPPAAEESPPAN